LRRKKWNLVTIRAAGYSKESVWCCNRLWNGKKISLPSMISQLCTGCISGRLAQ